MKIKFINPTDKYVFYLLGTDGIQQTVSVYINPNSHSVYEAKGDVWTRFFTEFEGKIKEYRIIYENN